MLLSFSISFYAFKFFHIQCVFPSHMSGLLLWSVAKSLPDACILERNGKQIFDIGVTPNWMLFISWKEAQVKGQLSSGSCSFSHFCESLSMPSFNKQIWEEIDSLLPLTIYSNMCV